MLTVGVDSYVSLEEAEELAAATNLSSDPAYQKWLTLSDTDKEVLLRTSCRDIDCLKFDGRKRSFSQRLQFPRVQSRVSGIGYRLFIGQFWDNGLDTVGNMDGGLAAVSQAQVVNAVYAGYYNELVTEQIGTNIQGLTKKKAGPIDESYGKITSDNNDALVGIYTKKVYSILASWLSSARFTY